MIRLYETDTGFAPAAALSVDDALRAHEANHLDAGDFFRLAPQAQVAVIFRLRNNVVARRKHARWGMRATDHRVVIVSEVVQ